MNHPLFDLVCGLRGVQHASEVGALLAIIPLTGVPCRRPIRISTQELHPLRSRRPTLPTVAILAGPLSHSDSHVLRSFGHVERAAVH